MKKSLIFLFVGLFVLGISSCQKTKDDINKLTEFDANYSAKVAASGVGSDTAAGLPIDTTITLVTPEIPTNIVALSSAAKTAINLIEEVKLTSFVISTEGSNLDFLKELSIYLKTDGADLAVASIKNIPANTTSVAATSDDVNIKSELTKDKIQFKIVTGFKAVPDSMQTKLNINLTVHIKGKQI